MQYAMTNSHTNYLQGFNYGTYCHWSPVKHPMFPMNCIYATYHIMALITPKQHNDASDFMRMGHILIVGVMEESEAV